MDNTQDLPTWRKSVCYAKKQMNNHVKELSVVQGCGREQGDDTKLESFN